MRALALVGVSVLLVCALVQTDAVPSRLRKSGASASASVGVGEECYRDVMRFVDDAEPTVIGFTALQAGTYSNGDRESVAWPADVGLKSTCKKNADWIYDGIFRFNSGNALPAETVWTIQNAGSVVANWEQTVLWPTPFPVGGRVCYGDLQDPGAGSVQHEFVIEAPAPNAVRHYQSFVGCYTIGDWLGAHAGLREAVQYRPGCSPVHAKTEYGAGQLLDGTKATERASYVHNFQTIIDAYAQGGGSAKWDAMRIAYRSLFGVDIPAGHTMTTPRLVLKCIDRNVARCHANTRNLRNKITRWRSANVTPWRNGLTALSQGAYQLTSIGMEDWVAAEHYATSGGRNWNAVVNDIHTKQNAYRRYIDRLANSYCTALAIGSAQYRVNVRNSPQYAAFRALTAGGGLQMAGTKASGGLGRPTTVQFDLTCTQTGAVDTHVPAGHQTTCTAWTLATHNTHTTQVVTQRSGASASRWELQVCTRPNGDVEKARWIPSATSI